MESPVKNPVVCLSIPVGLFILNFILKIWFLGSRDIASDEPFTIFYAQADFSSLFEMLKTENNPPLFFVLLHFWIGIFGISPFSVRFLPMLFSSLTAPVIYLTGKRFFSNSSGILAALIYTFSNYHLLFSHETRVYPLFALLTCISMYFFMALVRNPKSKKIFWFLILANVLIIYSHFFGFFVILVQLLSCFFFSDVRKIRRNYLVAQIITLAFYLPYITVLFGRFMASAGGTWVPTPVISDLYTMIWRFSNAPVVTVLFIVTLVVGLINYYFKRQRSTEPSSSFLRVLLVWFFFPYLFMFAISFIIPMFLDRYLVFVSIAFYLLVAESIVLACSRKILFYALSLVALGSMLITFNPNVDNLRHMREVVTKVKRLKHDEIPVFICPQWLDLGFTYYYNRDFFMDYKNITAHLNKDQIFPVNNADKISSVITAKTTNVILFEEWAEIADKENTILKLLSEKFATHREFKVPESYTIYYFSRRR